MTYKFRYGGALLGKVEKKAIMKVVESNHWPLAKQGELMEKEAAAYLGVSYGVLTNSGSSAALVALAALELEKGSEVIIPATTFPTVFNCILQCGLHPVVVDSKVGTYNLDPSELEQSITENTKAVIAINAVGNPPDYRKLKEICKRRNLVLIQDNCDGFGGELDGKKLETYADISFTSFHAAHIVAMGQGGGVFTNDKELARKARMYRDWGRQSDIKERTNNEKWPNLPKDYDARFIYEKVGYNLSPLELQAAMGRVQLKKTEMIKKKRRRNFDFLYENLKKHEQLIMPVWVDGADPSWFSFPLTTTGDRGPLVAYLEKKGIETRSMFAGRIDLHPAYANSEYAIRTDLKEADYILRQSFWITCHPRYSPKELKYIVDVFNTYFKRHA